MTAGNPTPHQPSTTGRSLLDFITDLEGETLAQLGHVLEEADGTVDRIRKRQAEIERDLNLRAAVRATSYRAAAARALGEEEPFSAEPPAPPPVDREELEAQAAGLRLRLAEAETERAHAKVALRSGIGAVVKRVCEEVLAPMYLEASKELAQAHELMSSAFQVLVDAGDRSVVASSAGWLKLTIPGHDRQHSPLLAARSRELWSQPVIYDATEAYTRGGPQAAVRRFTEAAKQITGAAWPPK